MNWDPPRPTHVAKLVRVPVVLGHMTLCQERSLSSLKSIPCLGLVQMQSFHLCNKQHVLEPMHKARWSGRLPVQKNKFLSNHSALGAEQCACRTAAQKSLQGIPKMARSECLWNRRLRASQKIAVQKLCNVGQNQKICAGDPSLMRRCSSVQFCFSVCSLCITLYWINPEHELTEQQWRWDIASAEISELKSVVQASLIRSDGTEVVKQFINVDTSCLESNGMKRSSRKGWAMGVDLKCGDFFLT